MLLRYAERSFGSQLHLYNIKNSRKDERIAVFLTAKAPSLVPGQCMLGCLVDVEVHKKVFLYILRFSPVTVIHQYSIIISDSRNTDSI